MPASMTPGPDGFDGEGPDAGDHESLPPPPDGALRHRRANSRDASGMPGGDPGTGADRGADGIGPLPQPKSRPALKGPLPPPLSERRPEFHRHRLSLRPAVDAVLPPLPTRAGPASFFARVWLVLALVLPNVAAFVYFGWVAADQYVSEFHFTVRSGGASGAGGSTGTSSLMASIFSGASGTGTGADDIDNYTAVDYMRSAQAMHDVDRKLNLREVFNRPQADPLARFDPRRSDTSLVRYWQRMVSSEYDPATGLAVVSVRAFTPQDAYAIATALTGLAESLANEISGRARADTVRFAQSEVDRLQRRVAELRTHITDLRDKAGVIDPNNSVVASNIADIANLRAEVAQIDTGITALTHQLGNSNAPPVHVLQLQRNAAEQQIAKLDAQVSRAARGNASLSHTVIEFEAATVDLQIAEQLLTAALGNLEQAQAQAVSQQLYITPYVRPALADGAAYPKRLTAIAIVAMVSLIVWGMGLLMANAVSQHGA